MGRCPSVTCIRRLCVAYPNLTFLTFLLLIVLLIDVVVEFGHNDGGSPDTSDRASVGGESDTDTQTVTLADGTVEVVHTFP